MEVAHKMAFGYGYLTWEWKLGIRSALYPIVIGSLFKFLQVFGMDSRTLVILAPRVLQAFISSIGDIFILKFAKLRCGPEVARWTLFAVMSSWFLFYCASRTIINSVETVLTNVSLYYFPWNIILKTNQDNKPIVRSYIKFLVTVAFGVIMRPTAAAFWMPLCLLLLWKLRRNTAIWQTSFAVGFSAILLCIAVDRVFYHRWIFTPFKFFHFNLWTDQSRIYGTHPWHWYITQGFPILMGVHLIPFLLQIKNTKLWWLLPIIAWNMIIFSFVAHKEFRFLMPILPMALVIVGEYFASNIRNGKTSRKWKCIKIVALLMVSVPHTLYFSIVHQRGTLDVMDGLHSVAQQNSEILFLLPCHSTPLYSHLHRNVSARFLTCEPNLNGVEGYVDEADVFYQDPSGWLETEFLVAGTENIPTHLVLFDSLSEIVGEFLSSRGYELNATFFHTHFPDGRVGSYIQIYERKYS